MKMYILSGAANNCWTAVEAGIFTWPPDGANWASNLAKYTCFTAFFGLLHVVDTFIDVLHALIHLAKNTTDIFE